MLRAELINSTASYLSIATKASNSLDTVPPHDWKTNIFKSYFSILSISFNGEGFWWEICGLPRRSSGEVWWGWIPHGSPQQTDEVPISPTVPPSPVHSGEDPGTWTTAHAQGNWSSQCLHLIKKQNGRYSMEWIKTLMRNQNQVK